MEVYLPMIGEVLGKLIQLAADWSAIPMLSRTHINRLHLPDLEKKFLSLLKEFQSQLKLQEQIPFSAKFGGATEILTHTMQLTLISTGCSLLIDS